MLVIAYYCNYCSLTHACHCLYTTVTTAQSQRAGQLNTTHFQARPDAHIHTFNGFYTKLR